ncbi:hypothetical protein GS506_29110 [Rhodococcus hoagii]|nr:hypothetical protein [Prescottella equi]
MLAFSSSAVMALRSSDSVAPALAASGEAAAAVASVVSVTWSSAVPRARVLRRHFLS